MPSQFDSLKSVLSLKHFPLNRSRYCMCSFGLRSKPKQNHQFTNCPQKSSRSLRAAYYSGSLHEYRPVRRKGTPEKETLFWTFFFSRVKRRQARYWERERSACYVTPDMSYEREGAWQSHAQKIREDGAERKRKKQWMYFLHFLVRVTCWSIGCCTSQ